MEDKNSKSSLSLPSFSIKNNENNVDEQKAMKTPTTTLTSTRNNIYVIVGTH